MSKNRPRVESTVDREATLLALLESHGGAVRRIARSYAGGDGEADDLYQEILLQLWRGLARFRGDSAPGTWLYRVALNTALTWRRSSRRNARGDSIARGAPAATVGAPRREAVILEEFLRALAPLDRSVLLLYLEGLAHEEIADVTGLSPGAIRVRIHRIKQTYTERYLKGERP